MYAMLGQGNILSADGREYQVKIANMAILERWPRFKDARIKSFIEAYPPDRRRRDIMNLEKGVSDGLEKARVFNDDFQIDDFRIVRRHVVKGGLLKARIEEI